MRRATLPGEDPDDINLGAIGVKLVRAIPRLVLIGFIVAGAVYAGLTLIAPRYESEALLAITSRATANPYQNPERSSAQAELSTRLDTAAINTHVRAIQSTDLAAKIVKDLKLAEYAEFNSAVGPADGLSSILRLFGIGLPKPNETDDSRALSEFTSRLRVYAPKESRSIVIGFYSSNPDRAAEIANRIADSYREMLAQQTISETEGVQLALEPQIVRLTKEAADAEAAVEVFRGKANIFKGGAQSGLNEKQLADLQGELSKIKLLRSDADARLRQARELTRSGAADVLPDVQKSRLVQNLVESRVRLERQISELSATLLPAHPRMRRLSADLTGLKRQIKREVKKIVDGIAKEARVAALREAALMKRVKLAKARIVNTGPDEAKLRTLEADARSKRAELERLRSQFEANRARLQDSRAIPLEAQLISLARPASSASFPKKGATAVLAFLATLLFGVAIVITGALLSSPGGHGRGPVYVPVTPSGGTPENVRGRITRQVSGSTPPGPSGAKEDGRASLRAVPGDALRSRGQSDQRLGGDTAPEVVEVNALSNSLDAVRQRSISGVRSLIVSEEDDGVVAREVEQTAADLARRGRSVIILDWASGTNGLAASLGRPVSPGLWELATGEVSFEAVVSPLDAMGVHFVAVGGTSKGGVADLSSEEVNSVFDALDGVYDHVLVVSGVEAGKALFALAEGRFDAGVILDRRGQDSRYGSAEQSMFLDFEVDGMDVIVHSIQSSSGTGPSAARIARAVRSVT